MLARLSAVVFVVSLASACSEQGTGADDTGPVAHDGSPAPDGALRPDGGPVDAAAADAGFPDPEYTVARGDCMRLWRVRTTGVPFEYADADANRLDDVGELLVSYAGEFAESRILIRAGQDGRELRSFPVAPPSGIDIPDGYRMSAVVRRVETGPDLSGDGIADLALLTDWFVAPEPSSGTVDPRGERGTAVQVVSGLDGSSLWQRLGASDLAWGGDAGGETLEDLVVGEPRQLVVLEGRTGAMLARLGGPSDLEGFPSEVRVLEPAPLRIAATTQRDTDRVIVALSSGSDAPLWRVEAAGFLEVVGGILDADRDGTGDLITRDFLGTGEGGGMGILARSGASGAALWRASVPVGAEPDHWGAGFAVGDDANGDSLPDVAAGTDHLLTGSTPTAGRPGFFSVFSGSDGSEIARVVHDLDPGTAIPPVLDGAFDGFGADIAAFDDPSERRGSAFAVTHEIVGRGAQHWLTAWSCRAGRE